MNRRTLLQILPALAALTETATAQQQQEAAQTPQRISKDTLRQALQLSGLKFKEVELDTMLPGVNRNLASYEALRKVNVPLDTEPAFQFNPLLPGGTLPSGKAKWVPERRKKTTVQFGSIDDLAFRPAVELAALVRSKKVTSTDLTMTYI